ncbi:MAG: hypothetical protein HWN65_14430 [Candidatus Helarchaeota archaeon]|nr:hypothetical protein [Candidatus Helarchaeota archaeon]
MELNDQEVQKRLEVEFLQRIPLKELGEHLLRMKETYGYQATRVVGAQAGILSEVLNDKFKDATLGDIGQFMSHLAEILGYDASVVIAPHRKALLNYFNEKLEKATLGEIGDFFSGLSQMARFWVNEIFQLRIKEIYRAFEEKAPASSLGEINRFLEGLYYDFSAYNDVIQVYRNWLFQTFESKLRDHPIGEIGAFLYFLSERSETLKYRLFQNRANLSIIFRENGQTSAIEEVGSFFASLKSIDQELAWFIFQDHKNAISELFSERLEAASIEKVTAFLSGIEYFSYNCANALLQIHRERFLASLENKLQETSIYELAAFLACLWRASKQDAKSFAESQRTALSSKFQEGIAESLLKRLGKYLYTLARCSDEAAQQVIRVHDKLLKKRFQDSSLYEIGEFLYWLASPPFIRGFIPTRAQEGSYVFGELRRERFLRALEGCFEIPKAAPVSLHFLQTYYPLLSELFQEKIRTCSLGDLSPFFYGMMRISLKIYLDFMSHHELTLLNFFDERLERLAPTEIHLFFNFFPPDARDDIFKKYHERLWGRFEAYLPNCSLPEFEAMILTLLLDSEATPLKFVRGYKDIILETLGEELHRSPLDTISFTLHSFALDHRPLWLEIVQILKDPLIETLQNHLEKTSLQEIGQFLGEFWDFDPNTRELTGLGSEMLVSCKTQLSSALSEKIPYTSLTELGRFLHNVAWISNPIAKEFIKAHIEAISDLFGVRLSSSSFQEIEDFLSSIGQISKKTRKWLAEKHHAALVEQVERRLRGDDFPLKEICEAFRQCIHLFGSRVPKVIQRYQDKFLQAIDLILEKATLADFATLLKSAPGDVVKQIVRSHKRTLSQLLFRSSLKDIGSFIEMFHLKGFPRELLVKYGDKFMEIFGEKIRFSSLSGINCFLHNFYYLDPERAGEIVASHEDSLSKVFSQRIKQSDVSEINRFLSNLVTCAPLSAIHILHATRATLIEETQAALEWVGLDFLGDFLSTLARISEPIAQEVLQAYHDSVLEKWRIASKNEKEEFRSKLPPTWDFKLLLKLGKYSNEELQNN